LILPPPAAETLGGHAMTVSRLLWCLPFLLALAQPAAADPPADKPAADAPAEKAEKPAAAKKAPLYDPKADATKQIDAAVKKAQRDSSRVLVMYGFEGCVWCQRLHGLFQKDENIRKLVHDEYVFVPVDIKSPHADEHLKAAKAALAKEELEKGVGYPFLAVLGGDGKVVTAQRTDPLEEGKGHSPERVKEFLDRWVAPKADAKAVLKDALDRAEKEDKRVFLHFGAPWCGWCHKLEDFLAREEIAAILGPDFVDVKIDTDRMTHGKEVMKEYCEKQGGIPWFAILDAKGKALATSDGPKGNIGYPAEPHEIDHFLAMLKQGARKLEPDQVERIEAALRKAAAEIEAARKR
jgi:thioredoxin-related protein